MKIGTASAAPKNQAMSAPKVTISAWAKFDSPVVPKTSERPICRKAQHEAEVQPADEALDDLIEEGRHIALALADEEVGGHTTTGSDRDGLHVRGIADHRDSIGECGLVERHLVVGLLRHSDAPFALCVGCYLGVVAAALDRKLDALKGIAVVLDIAADAIRVVLDADLVGMGSGCGAEQGGQDQQTAEYDDEDRAQPGRGESDGGQVTSR